MNRIISYSKNHKKAQIIYNCETIHIHNLVKDIWIDTYKNLYTIKQMGKPEPIRVKMNDKVT